MTIAKFEKVLPLLKIGKADREYFLRWLKRYGGCQNRRTGHDYQDREDLPVTTEDVIAFSRELLASKTPAWQRLQAVRAIEFYRDAVLGTDVPSLTNITRTLKHLAAKEEALGNGIVVSSADQERMVGIIDENEPVVLSRDEIVRLLPEFQGNKRLMFKSLSRDLLSPEWT